MKLGSVLLSLAALITMAAAVAPANDAVNLDKRICPLVCPDEIGRAHV